MDGPVRRPLKDKLRDHWNTRDEIFRPKPEKANKMGTIFVWTFVPSLAIASSFLLIPHAAQLQDPSGDSWVGVWMQLAIWFLFVQIMGNWLLTAGMRGAQATQDNVPQQKKSGADTATLAPNWKHCPVCQLDVPPRSHHCRLCQMCVLKRDHHCFFTGTCIGWGNQRRFIVFCFYVFIGSMFGIMLLVTYLVDTAEAWTSHWYYFLPGMSLVPLAGGSMSLLSFVLCLLMYAGCITLITGGGFLIWETLMMLRGQTSYEASHNIHTYRMRPLEGIRSVFGNYGLVHFLLPFSIPQVGDGVTWQPYKSTKCH